MPAYRRLVAIHQVMLGVVTTDRPRGSAERAWQPAGRHPARRSRTPGSL